MEQVFVQPLHLFYSLYVMPLEQRKYFARTKIFRTTSEKFEQNNGNNQSFLLAHIFMNHYMKIK